MSGEDFSPFGRGDIFRISDHHDFRNDDIEEPMYLPFLSYSDYLNGSVDYGQLINASPADTINGLGASGSGGCKSGGTTPLTPNSSASSSSTEDVDKHAQEQPHAKEEAEDGRDHDKSKKVMKPRKKGEKRKREARFAFMTKSEVDHLEDGYRWRKYGQKAVKNSPYPRSYYRCTTQKCGVKKRVERSFQDPEVVITTYEGQHTHQSPATVRGSSHFLAGPAPPPASVHLQELLMHRHHDQFPQILLNNINIGNGANGNDMFLPSPLQQLQFPDYGLLQDIVPSFNANQP